MRTTVVLLLILAGGLRAQPRVAETVLGPNLPAQPAGASDLLAVSVYGAPELTRTVRVSQDGTVRIPMLAEPVAVAGLMPAEIEQRIAAALAQQQILVDPVVTVTIAEFASRPVSVVGAVRRPLTFQAGGQTTLLDALARAEGLTPEAGAEILVTRTVGGAPQTRRVGVKDLLEAADPASNLTLAGGEEVRVPAVGRVFVVGNVKTPGAFPVPGGMSVLKALALAEGLSPFAARQAYIYRPAEGGGKREIEVELRRIMDRRQPDVELLAGDVFYIPDSRGRRLAANIIDNIVNFGVGAGSSALIFAVR
jgi:polysaccharide export outer membrane protein